MCMMGMSFRIAPSIPLEEDEQMCSAKELVDKIIGGVRQECEGRGVKGVVDVFIEPRLVATRKWAGESAGRIFSELIDPNDENGFSDKNGISLRPEALAADRLLTMAKMNYLIRAEKSEHFEKDELTSAALMLPDEAQPGDGARRKGAVVIPVGMISGRYLGCPHRGEDGMLIYVSVCTDATEDQDEQTAWSAVGVIDEAIRHRNDMVLIRCLYG